MVLAIRRQSQILFVRLKWALSRTASEHFEMFGARSMYRLQGNRPVECRQAAAAPDCEAEQIHVRNLLVAGYGLRPKQAFIKQRYGFFPKLVVRSCAKNAEARRHFGGSRVYRRVGRAAQNPNAAVDRHGACGPAAFSVSAEPPVGILVVGVRGIEQCDQDVDIQQRRRHSSSRNRLTSAK